MKQEDRQPAVRIERQYEQGNRRYSTTVEVPIFTSSPADIRTSAELALETLNAAANQR